MSVHSTWSIGVSSILIFLPAAFAFPGIQPSSIYGQDSRKDLHEVDDPALLELADSTVALVRDSQVAGTRLRTSPYAMGSLADMDVPLCSNERFYEQRKAAFCSGALVGPDLVLTAGHCVDDFSDCRRMKFVFGFGKKTENQDPSQIRTRDVYGCAALVTRVLDHPYGADFALIRLDRRVVGHQAIGINRTGRSPIGTHLVVIGHPNGLPTKVSEGQVLRNARSNHFSANLDAFAGNSGSAVFNRETGLIEGVLVRGPADNDGSGDWDLDLERQCLSSQKYAEIDLRSGIDVTKIALLAARIPELEYREAPAPAPAPSPSLVPAPRPILVPAPRPTLVPAPQPSVAATPGPQSSVTPQPPQPPRVVPIEPICVKETTTFEIQNIRVRGIFPASFDALPRSVQSRVTEVIRKLERGIRMERTRVARVASVVAPVDRTDDECRVLIELTPPTASSALWSRFTGQGLLRSVNADGSITPAPGLSSVRADRIYLTSTRYLLR